MSRQPLRIGLIGCGDVSSVHLDAIEANPDARLVAICDVDPVRLERASDRTGVPGHRERSGLLAAAPDVVHVCTPHNTHAPIAAELLEAGVAVLLEKPVAHDREALRLLTRAVQGSSAPIGICFQNRYNSPVQAARRLIESGAVGEILGASASLFWHRDEAYYRASPWRGRWDAGGGGLLMNQAIHTIDLLQWLLGDVTQVAGGIATRSLGAVIEVEDTADLVLTHRGGARSTFFATLSHVTNEPVRICISGSEAHLELNGDLTAVYADGRREVFPEGDTRTGERAYWGASHERLIADFYRTVRRGERFWIDVAEAAKSLDIIQAVYEQSAAATPPAAGRTPREALRGSDSTAALEAP